MRAFGLELRKIKHYKTENLYEDVDRVLKSYNTPKGGVSHDVQTQSIAHSLQKMLSTQKHFDICTIKECAEMAQIVISVERLRVYKPLHCMDWSEMTDEFRQIIVAMVLDDFRPVLSPQEENDIQSIVIN